MGGGAVANIASKLIERIDPRCLAMCGVCAGHPEDTAFGDVVIADRLFQHDERKIKTDGHYGDLWVDPLRNDWLRIAQDLEGAAVGLHGYAPPQGDLWKWWFLEQLAAGRTPQSSTAYRRYLPDDVRDKRLQYLLDEGLIERQGRTASLTSKGQDSLDSHRFLNDAAVVEMPFHVLVGPMGSGSAVEASGAVWERLSNTGMRKVRAIEMEAAAIGRVAHDRGIPFAVAKGVMDHADSYKDDRFKPFAERAAAEVLCHYLRQVVKPEPGSKRVTRPGRFIDAQTSDIGPTSDGHDAAPGGPPSAAPGGSSEAEDGRSVKLPDHSDWNAVQTLASLLGRAPRSVVTELDECLGGEGMHRTESEPESGAEMARRVAVKIDGLGSGFEAAQRLISAAEATLAETRAVHPGDLGQGRRVLCWLLNEWMPRRYDGGQGLARELKRPGGCSDLDADVEARMISAYLVASANRRAATIRRHRGATSVEVPFAAQAEMLSPQRLAEKVVGDLTTPHPGQFEDSPSGRLNFAKRSLTRFRRTTKKGTPIDKTPPWNITLSHKQWQELLGRDGREILKGLLPDLRQVALMGSRRPEEADLVQSLLNIYEGHDDTEASP